MKKEEFYESMQHFQRLDGENYNGCLKQIWDLKTATCLEFRIHRSGEMHIIQFFARNAGYDIYKQQN